MITRLRETQFLDKDLLTEEEAAERFIFKDGYGPNDSSLILDGYVNASDFYLSDQLLFESSTFTPVVTVGGESQTLTSALGFYTRVKDVVTIAISVQFINSKSDGIVLLESLPFAAKNITGLIQQLSVNTSGLVAYSAYGSVAYGTVKYSSVERPLMIAKLNPNENKIYFGHASTDANLSVLMPNSILTFNVTGSYLT